jgi:hemerythrin
MEDFHMAFFNWSDKYSVSVSQMDSQHKQLIQYLNDLFDAMSKGQSKEIVGPILTKLVGYTKTHFSAEENYLKMYNYPEFAKQKKEHDAFVAKIQDFENEFKSGKLAVSLEISNFLKNWLAQHISIEDKKYGSFLNAKGLK